MENKGKDFLAYHADILLGKAELKTLADLINFWKAAVQYGNKNPDYRQYAASIAIGISNIYGIHPGVTIGDPLYETYQWFDYCKDLTDWAPKNATEQEKGHFDSESWERLRYWSDQLASSKLHLDNKVNSLSASWQQRSYR